MSTLAVLELRAFAPRRWCGAGRAPTTIRPPSGRASSAAARIAAATGALDLIAGGGEAIGVVMSDAGARKALARSLAAIAPWRGRYVLRGVDQQHGAAASRRHVAMLADTPLHEGPRVGDLLADMATLFAVPDPAREVADLLEAWGGGRTTRLRDLGPSRVAALEVRLALARRPALLVADGFLGRVGAAEALTCVAADLRAAAAHDVVLLFLEARAGAFARLPEGMPSRLLVARGAVAPLELALPATFDHWRVVEAEGAGGGAEPLPRLEGLVAQAASGGRLVALVQSDRADVAVSQLRVAGARSVSTRAPRLDDLDLLTGPRPTTPPRRAPAA